MDKAEEVKARERSKKKRERDQGVNRIIFQQKRQQLPKYHIIIMMCCVISLTFLVMSLQVHGINNNKRIAPFQWSLRIPGSLRLPHR